eukprot:204017-Hanusia_phi.AAC.4
MGQGVVVGSDVNSEEGDSTSAGGDGVLAEKESVPAGDRLPLVQLLQVSFLSFPSSSSFSNHKLRQVVLT